MRERNYEGAKVAVLINDITCRGQEPNWLEKEIQRCKDYCAKWKWELNDEDIYIEDNVSGLADMSKRPELRKLLANAEEQGYDVVLVPEVKHLGRNLFMKESSLLRLLDEDLDICIVAEEPYLIKCEAFSQMGVRAIKSKTT